MIHDENDLKNGMRFIVGTWSADYLVNALSDDLAHIPASEFKSDDGTDFSALTFEFFEDRSVVMKNSATGREEKGSWEQTALSEYHYTLNGFSAVPEGAFRENAETMSVHDGRLVFSIGFLAIALKKTADGVVTEKPGVGETPGDPDACAIVGRYKVARLMSAVGDDFGMHTREEIEADLFRRRDAGEDVEEELSELERSFGMLIEFTPDHRVVSWVRLPDGVSAGEIEEAVKAGEIGEVRDGMFTHGEPNEWKALNGSYYYDTGETRELFGEAQSSWDELKPDAEGLIPFGSGMILIKRAD